MDDGLRKNDPYRGMESGKSGIRPGFLGGKGGGEAPSGKAAKNDSAVKGLRAAEDDALQNGITSTGEGVSGAERSEEEAGGYYSGAGRGLAGDKKKKKVGGVFKKRGPIVAIILAIFGVGGIMSMAQLFQPFSLIAQFTESFNSMHASANLRSSTFFRMQMDPSGRVKNPIKGKIFGADTFKITDSQASNLRMQGIDYDNNFEGTGLRVLKFDDGTGEIRIVAADDASAKRLTELNLKNFDTDNIKYNTEAVSFRNLYNSNADFFNGYNKGSLTWRGAVANWFGTMTANFLSSNKLTRNMFKDFQKQVAESNDGNTKRVAQEIMAKRADEVAGGGVKRKSDTEAERGEDNKKTGRGVVGDGEDEIEGYNRKSITTETEAKTKLTDVASKYAGRSNAAVNIGCTMINVLGGISLLVSAHEALQIINLTTAYFEVVDKTKAGDGDNTPINDFANALNEKKTTTNYVLTDTGTWDYSNSEDNNVIKDENGEVIEIKSAVGYETVTTDKSAMQSSGIAALYGGGAVDPNDASVQSFNFSNSIKTVLGGFGTSMVAFETCALAKMAANFVTAASDAVSVVACVAGLFGAVLTFGVSAVAGCGGALAIGALKSVIVGVGIAVVVSAVVSAITPVAANMLTRDLISELGGEDLGNALTSGANMYLGNTHRANGGSLSNRAQYIAFAARQQEVIAENAKFERQSLSPFDLTSKYTFLGTIMTQMMSFLTTSSLMSVVTTGGSVVSSSTLAMLPTASAYDVASTLPSEEDYMDTCPYLASIGAVGDAYCNPYATTDVSTMNIDPSSVIEVLNDPNGDGDTSDSNFQEEDTSDGNVRVAGNSDLAKYIMFCDQRESAFGIADQNIANEIDNWQIKTSNSTVNAAANAAIGAIPVVGDVIDVVSNSKLLANVGYVSGESCVAGNNVDRAGSPGWNTAKYYQRFIEDQALAESMGLINKSAVTAFLEDYYEENPLDTSYEGILARKSGLEKETVVALLDYIEYADYVAKYNPSTRYAFGAPAVTMERELKFNNEKIDDNLLIEPVERVVYADLRSRSFTVA